MLTFKYPNYLSAVSLGIPITSSFAFVKPFSEDLLVTTVEYVQILLRVLENQPHLL